MSDTAKRGSAEMRYLLGDLSEDEKTRMEEAFFADNAKFEELELAEEELIDAYVRDYLSPDERRQFQAKLLRSPRLIDRVNFARVLAEKVDAQLQLAAEESIAPASVTIPLQSKLTPWWKHLFSQQPAFGAAFATAGIVLLIGGGILSYGWLRLRSESVRFTSERAEVQRQSDELEKLSTEQRVRIEQLNAELQQARSQQTEDQRRIQELELAQKTQVSNESSAGPIFSFILTTTTVRSDGNKKPFKIPLNASSVELKLPLETNDYRSYNVIIKNVDTGVPIKRFGLKPQRSKSGRQLIFRIPARLGDYTIEVTGRTPSGTLEPVTDSQFSIIRQ